MAGVEVVGEFGRLGDGPVVHHREERVEQEEVAGPAGVDYPGLGEHGQQLGCPGQGLGRPVTGRIEHVHQ